MNYPLIVLSHRKREFLETALDSIKRLATGITNVIVVDDSGDAEHHDWLGNHDYQFSLSSPDGSNIGYLGAMQTLWEVGREVAAESGSEYVVVWEEDFTLTREVDFHNLALLLEMNPQIAQLNLQRQAVYKIERVLGYMESHQNRGYGLTERGGVLQWVERCRPFTTNPSLIRREVLDIDWPPRRDADRVRGGAEPAMSRRLEAMGYTFGWYGAWNNPYTHHMGHQMKTGKGY